MTESTTNSIDLPTFNELQETTGAEFTAELVGTFLDEAPQLLEQLTAALTAGQADNFRRTAHSLKTNALTFGALALASMGGGGNKSKEKSVKPEFTPIKTTNGFTLKAGPSYRGSMILGQDKNNAIISFNSIVTYQKGNTTYILPYKYKLQTSSYQSAKSNLQMFNLRLKIHK